jgi:ABC-2 type transport system permease protein
MKALYIIKREYRENIKKKSFIISTILAPVFLLIVYAIPILAIFFEPSEQVRVAVVDRTGEIAPRFVPALDDTLKDGRPKFIISEPKPAAGDFDALKASLIHDIEDGHLDVLIELPDSVVANGRVNYVSKNVFNERTLESVRDKLNSAIMTERFRGRGMDYAEISRLTREVSLNENKITRSGVIEEEQVVGEFILVVFFVMILYTSLLSWGMSVQRSIIEEKSSRVIELMLSSVDAKDLFIGKIIGVGALGLTQITVWSAMIMLLTFSSAVVTSKFMDFVHVTPSEIFFFILFFVLGFLLYSSIFTVVGAVCNTEQEAQQLQMIVIMPLIVPIMMMVLVAQNPNTTLAVVLSMIPFFTPMLMLARIVVSEPSAWQVILSIVLLLLTMYGVIWFAARVFRVGILMYGKRPSLREIVRWSRYS